MEALERQGRALSIVVNAAFRRAREARRQVRWVHRSPGIGFEYLRAVARFPDYYRVEAHHRISSDRGAEQAR